MTGILKYKDGAIDNLGTLLETDLQNFFDIIKACQKKDLPINVIVEDKIQTQRKFSDVSSVEIIF